MTNKYIILASFVIVVLAQWFVPAKMVFDQEKVLRIGKEYKFKAAPIDPYDAFRGKYIVLSYDQNEFSLKESANWQRDELVYVHLANDAAGYATISNVTKEKPTKDGNFVIALVNYVQSDTPTTTKVFITYPFDRFYMEESKAADAERIYGESLRDSTQVTFALVNIHEGHAVLKDVMIDGVPIREAVLKQRK